MKTRTFLNRIAVIIIIAFLAVGCDQTPTETLECSVLIDITGSNASTSSLEHLGLAAMENLLKTSDDQIGKRTVIYRQSLISDTFMNHQKEFILPPAPSFFTGNSFDYKDRQAQFFVDVSTAIDQAKKDTTGRGYSSVYVPVARELRKLAQSKSQERILVVYSDLIENNDFLTFLDTNKSRRLRQLRALNKNPKKFEKLLQEEMPLPNDLQGITVYIIHNPDTATERYFKPLLALYEKMLSKRGAVVISQANL